MICIYLFHYPRFITNATPTTATPIINGIDRLLPTELTAVPASCATPTTAVLAVVTTLVTVPDALSITYLPADATLLIAPEAKCTIPVAAWLIVCMAYRFEG